MFATNKAALAAAVLALSATPLAASAQQTAYSTSPVSIAACNVSTHLDGYSAGWYSNPISTQNLSYRFVNNGAVPATKVTLLVKDDTGTRSIEDNGTFSPGVAIDRNLADGAGYQGGNLNCQVSSVQFADGSSWQSNTANVATR